MQGERGAMVGGQAHHTEHLWAGFMGESLGQWKARPNSSNWDTLPNTLGRDPQSVGPRGHQTPAVLSHPTRTTPSPPPQHKEGMRPRQAGGRTCSALVRACRSAPAGRWTATAA